MSDTKALSKAKLGSIRTDLEKLLSNTPEDKHEEATLNYLSLQATAQSITLESLQSQLSELMKKRPKINLSEIDKLHRLTLSENVNTLLGYLNLLLDVEVNDIDTVKYITDLQKQYQIVAVMHSHEYGLKNRQGCINKRRDFLASWSPIWTPPTDTNGNPNEHFKMSSYAGGWCDSDKEEETPEMERSKQYFSNYVHSAKRNGYRIKSIANNFLTVAKETYLKVTQQEVKPAKQKQKKH